MYQKYTTINFFFLFAKQGEMRMFMKEMNTEYKTKPRNMQKEVRDERSKSFWHFCITVFK